MTDTYDLYGNHFDTFTRDGACRIAAQIVCFWLGRGNSITVELVQDGIDRKFNDRRTIWCVRSNLINGLPR